MRSFIVVIIIISLQNINCRTKNNLNEFPELVFRYDKSLLLPTSNFENLSLSIPLNFEKVSGDKYLSVVKKLEANADSYFDKDILSIYQHSDGHVIVISKINDLKSIYGRLDKDFELGLIEISGASETNRGQFLIDNKETVQYITTYNTFVNYKLFFDILKNKCYQIDYFIPLNKFITFQSSVEASISTFKIKK